MKTPDIKLINAMWVGVFQTPQNAFYASLACSLNLEWVDNDSGIPTAATDGETIFYNVNFFNRITPKQRLFVFMHELDHVARLHMPRKGNRNHKFWNYACDFEINNDWASTKDASGRYLYDLTGLNLLIDKQFKGMSAEQIYDIIIKNGKDYPNDLDGDFQARPGTPLKDVPLRDIISRVVTACDAAERAGPGNIPGGIRDRIETFTRPVIKWENKLNRFMTELSSPHYSYSKRNRRFPDVIMPSLVDNASGLAHLVYFYDVSASVTRQQITRFNTEVVGVQKRYKPKKITIITFDTKIKEVIEYDGDSPIKNIDITRGGGTNLKPVYDWLVKNKPTAAVIFSDLGCHPMENPMVPVFWGVIGDSPAFKPKFGTVIPIPDEPDDF